MIPLEGTWFLVFMMSDGTLALCLQQNQHTAKSPTKSNEVQRVLVWELQRHFCIFFVSGQDCEYGTWNMKMGCNFQWYPHCFISNLYSCSGWCSRSQAWGLGATPLAKLNMTVRSVSLESDSVVLHCFMEMWMFTIKLKTHLKGGQLGYTAK